MKIDKMNKQRNALSSVKRVLKMTKSKRMKTLFHKTDSLLASIDVINIWLTQTIINLKFFFILLSMYFYF